MRSEADARRPARPPSRGGRAGWRFAAVDLLARAALDPLLATVRFRVRGEEHLLGLAGRPFIFVLWHGRLLPLTYRHRRQGISTLISASRDGEHIARVVRRWGYRVVRGSSSSGGGEALRRLVRELRRGRLLAITPDGPRGPRQRLKPGAVMAARLGGAPLLPLSAGCSRAWWLGGWDRFLVPKPFAAVRVAYGEPHVVPRDADEAELERARVRLERDLNRLTAEVDAGIGFP